MLFNEKKLGRRLFCLRLFIIRLKTNVMKAGTKLPGSKKAQQTSTVATENKWPIHIKLAILLGFVGFAVYANTIPNGYVLDDQMVILHDSLVTKGVTNISKIFTSPYLAGSIKAANDHYKPLSLAMFAAEYQISGGMPGLSHAVNVLVFSGCVILLFLFLNALFERKTTAAFTGALLFALHPINTEVVANLKSRDQLLCFFFGFLALNLYLRYLKTKNALMLMLGSFAFFLSLISKETTITFLAIIPIIFFLYRNEHKTRSIYITVSSFIAAIIFLFIRHLVLGAYHISNSGVYSLTDNPLANAPSLAYRVAMAFWVLGNYIKLLVIPYPLCCDYSYHNIPLVSFANIWVLLSLTFYLLLTGVSIYLLMKSKRNSMAFAILLFLIPLSVSSNIIIVIGAGMAERLLFFSAAGFCFAVALCLEKWMLRTSDAGNDYLKSRKLLAVLIPMAAIYIILTTGRNTDWKDNYTLYTADSKKAPDDARICYFLANELFQLSADNDDLQTKRQFADEGIIQFRKALAIYPSYEEAHSSIGNGFYILSQYDSAAYHFRQVKKSSPRYAEAIHNLAGVYFSERKFDSALVLCRMINATNGFYMDGFKNLALCYMQLKMSDSAIYILRKAMQVNSAYNGTYENLALAYKLKENEDSAKKYESIAQRQNPNFRVY